MKENTKLLLLWLYCDRVGERWVSVQDVKKLLSNLSDAGLKSLLFLLDKKQVILTEKIKDEQHVCITSNGKRMLEAQFPSILGLNEEWNGNWTQIVFLKPPNSDKNFRYLRKKLLSLNYIAISRGVFMHAGKLSQQLIELCDQLYKNSVLILSINKWEFGDELSIMGFKSVLSDVKDSYSSISREVDQLIDKINTQKGLTDSIQVEIYSVFNRYYKILTSDLGLINYYFPQEEKSLDLLNRIKNLQQYGI